MSEQNRIDAIYVRLLEDARNLKNLTGMERITEARRIVQEAEDLFDTETFDGVTINMERITADLEIMNLAGEAFNESLAALAPSGGYTSTEFSDSMFSYMETNDQFEFDWDSLSQELLNSNTVLPVPNKLDNSEEKTDHDTSDNFSVRDNTLSDEILTDLATLFDRELNLDNDVASEKNTDSSDSDSSDEDKANLHSASVISPSRTTHEIIMVDSNGNNITSLPPPEDASDEDVNNLNASFRNLNLSSVESFISSTKTTEAEDTADKDVTSVTSPSRTTQDRTTEVSTVNTLPPLLSPKICSDDDFSNYRTPSVSPTLSEDFTREHVTDENIILEFVNQEKSVAGKPDEYSFVKDFIDNNVLSKDLNKESFSTQEILTQVDFKPADQVLDIIKKEYERRGAIPFYELVCDPQSFEMTVDNIAHVASLLKSRQIAMLSNDNEQFMIQPIPAEEKDSPQYALREGYESAFTLDKKTWKKIMKIFKIESAIIRIPDRD